MLLGRSGCIERAHPARNLEPTPARFLIDPQDHFAAIHAARASGQELVGVYHSHPASEPVPSPRDLAEASYPDYVYVIVSPAGERPAVRLFRLAAAGYVEEPLVIRP